MHFVVKKMKIDLHVHTQYSLDSIMDLKKLMKKSKRTAIIPAITDHNTLAAHKELKKMNFEFIPGEEVSTVEGGLLALYIQEVIPKHTPFLEAIDKIKEQGGVSIVPHMYDSTRDVVNMPRLAVKADVIEVFNARCMLQVQNEKALAFAKKHNKIHSAGSDSHFPLEFGYTHVEVPSFDLQNPKALLRILKKGKVHGKKAPFFVRGATLGVKLFKKIFNR